jgi:hypothetical protein
VRPFDAAAPELAIIGFHRDEEGHWVADLACGHAQHVRHAPPLQTRAWVLTAEGRAEHLGTPLRCMRCLEGQATDDVSAR